MSAIMTVLRTRERRSAVAAAVALALQACGGGNNGTPPASPTVSISVNPTTITVGQAATLTWSSTQATSCSASGGWSGSQQPMGSATETPTAAGTVTYTLTCSAAAAGGYGGGGSAPTASQSATLTVNAPPPPTAFRVTKLVADGAGVGATQDTNLVNPWGLVFFGQDPVWIANNATNTSSLYDGNGLNQKLLVALPAAADGKPFEPTGIVGFDSQTYANDFVVSAAGKSGASSFIYSGLGGQIAGWSAAVDTTHAISVYTATDKACYRGLAIANNGKANFLYANDFVGGKIDVFDAKFVKQSPTAFPFKDPKLPQNYAPFGIQAIANGPNGTLQIYVSYAMSGTGADQGTCEDTRGAGFGMIDVFDTNGNLVMGELIPVGQQLNAPWGMALAPSNFGTLSNTLLISNHADGTINAFDPVKGTFIGALQTTDGPFAQDGLWGIAFGNGGALMGVDLQQPKNTLFFTAGPAKAANGVYGRIDLPAM